jgi:hypothetical protein
LQVCAFPSPETRVLSDMESYRQLTSDCIGFGIADEVVTALVSLSTLLSAFGRRSPISDNPKLQVGF